MPKINQINQSKSISNQKPYFQIFVMEYSIDLLVYNKVHHKIKLLVHQVHKQHESKLILMLAKMHYNDLLLDIKHKSIQHHRKTTKEKIFHTGLSICAKQGVQNQYSDGDDESDDLSSNASAL
jgi:hypothetical protein